MNPSGGGEHVAKVGGVHAAVDINSTEVAARKGGYESNTSESDQVPNVVGGQNLASLVTLQGLYLQC